MVTNIQDTRPEIGKESIKKLLNAVDAWVPQPVRDLDKPFLMPIENAFSIAGRGTVLTGKVLRAFLHHHCMFILCRWNVVCSTRVMRSRCWAWESS